MLSNSVTGTGRRGPGRAGPKRTRTRQRLLHLLAGVVIVAYVYAAPALDSTADTVARWFVLPVLVISGVVLWQWPRLRRWARRRRSKP